MVVLFLMDGEGPGLAEALVTHIALEGLVLAVDVLVVTEMVLPPEGLAADVAGEGPLVCVSSFVDHHIVTLGEFSMAELADEPLLGTRASVLVAEIQSWVIGGWWSRGGCRGGEKS